MAEAEAEASALVDLLLGNERGDAVGRRISGHALHAPAHIDAEILSALGQLQGAIGADRVETIHELLAASVQRHPLADLLLGAWARLTSCAWPTPLHVELERAKSDGTSRPREYPSHPGRGDLSWGNRGYPDHGGSDGGNGVGMPDVRHGTAGERPIL